MQAILFPYTYIPATVCKALAAYFRPLWIYQPTSQKIPATLQALSRKGYVHIAVPVGNDDEKIMDLLREYRNLAYLHQDGLRDYLKRRTQAVPFFDESSISRLKGDIRKGASKAEKEEPLLKARLFLQLAQEHDLQNEEIDRKLEETRRAEKKLFSDLLNGLETAAQMTTGTSPEQNVTSSGYMLHLRITAWTQLFWKNTIFDPTAGAVALITAHSQALEYLLERMPESEPILRGVSLPIPKEHIAEHREEHGVIDQALRLSSADVQTRLVELVAGFENETQNNLSARLTLYRVTGGSAARMFSDLINRSHFELKGDFLKTMGQIYFGLFELSDSGAKVEG